MNKPGQGRKEKYLEPTAVISFRVPRSVHEVIPDEIESKNDWARRTFLDSEAVQKLGESNEVVRKALEDDYKQRFVNFFNNLYNDFKRSISTK